MTIEDAAIAAGAAIRSALALSPRGTVCLITTASRGGKHANCLFELYEYSTDEAKLTSVETHTEFVNERAKEKEINPPRLAPLKRSFASRWFGYDIFLSFALGPPPRGTQGYASDLARRLRERDFTVFFSEEEMPPGEQLDGALRKALLRSRALVVIVNRGTLQEPRWVRTEVEEFRRAHPSRLVIPVNIGGALQEPSLASTAQGWLDFAGRVWVDEAEDAAYRGIASREVVNRLSVVPTSTKANVKWRWIVRGSVAVLTALSVALGVSTKVALDNAERARAELRGAVASRLVIQGQQMLNGTRAGGDMRGILQLLAASRISTTQEVTGALLDALLSVRNVRKLLTTNVPVWSVSVSSDGRRVVSGHDDHTVRLWDAATGQPVGPPLRGHSEPVSSVAFSPDAGLVVSGSQDHSLRLWDAETGKPRGKPLNGHAGPVTSLAFSPDGRQIVSGGLWDLLKLWDTATGASLSLPFESYQQVVRAVAFSPDGRRIVSGGDYTLLLDSQTLKPIGPRIQAHSEPVSSVAFSPDGRRIVTGSDDKTLRLWDTESGKPLGAPLEGHKDAVRSVAFSPDGRRIVSGSFDNTLRLWDANTGKPLSQPLEGHRAPVSSVAFSPDGGFIVSASTAIKFARSEPDEARVRLWVSALDASLGKPIQAHRGAVLGVALSPDGRRIVTGGNDKTLRLWDTESGKPLGAPLEGHKDAVRSVAFSPDGRRIVTGSLDNTLRLWDADTGKPLNPPLMGHTDAVFGVAFSPDGRRIVSVSGSTIRRLRSSNDNELRLWDAVTGKPLSASIEGHQRQIRSVAFSPDNRRIVSGSFDGTLRLWDAGSGQPLGEPLKGHDGGVESVAFSADGRLIASSGDDKTVRLWDAATGKPLGAPLLGHRSSVHTVAFSPDGRHLVSGGEDGTLRFWDTKTGRPLGSALQGHSAAVTTVVYSPDGRRIVSGSFDNTLRLWPAPESWAGLLCDKITRNASAKEWDEWVSAEIPYECQCSGLSIPADDGASTASPQTCEVKK